MEFIIYKALSHRLIRKTFLGASLAIALLCLQPISSALAGDATLTWDANTDGLTTGYVVYYGQASRSYSSSIDVNNQTTYTFTGLGTGTYYFAVTAHDAQNNQSPFSNEVSKTFTVPDTTPPVISAIGAGSITSSGATISWTTDEPSDSQVQYGTTAAYGSSTTLSSSMVTSHSQLLSGLSASTVYHYRVLSRDAAGNLATSGDNTFTTSAPPDTTPPVISNILASNITNGGATITWTTDEASNSQVQYGTTTAYGSTSTLSNSMVTSHSRSLTGLQASTLYHYRVLSRDTAGNLATSGDSTFTTSSAPDTTPPVISNVSAGNIQYNSANITWTTNEAATSQVEFGTTTGYGSSTGLDSTLLTGHSMVLVNLTGSTMYHFRVRSADGSGNLSVSGDQVFTTPVAPDTTPPGNVQNFNAQPGDQQIALSWVNPPDPDFVGVRILYRTDRYPSDINDGTLLGDFSGVPSQSMITVHKPLQIGATYFYSASSYDSSGNFQHTAYASATVMASSSTPASSSNNSVSGGCGMVRPTDGNPPGPGQAADMVGLFAIILIAILKREIQRRKWLDSFEKISDIIYTTHSSYKQIIDRKTSGSHTLYHSLSQWFPVMRSSILTANALLLILLSISGNVFAGDATLTWDAISNPNLAGYKVYYGNISGNYGSVINAGNKTTQTVTGLGLGTYYFAVAAYDTVGNEGGLSNEVFKTFSADGSSAVGGNGPSGGTNSSSMAGGCGMIRPTDGKPSNPAQAADMVALLSIPFFTLIRRKFVPWIAVILRLAILLAQSSYGILIQNQDQSYGMAGDLRGHEMANKFDFWRNPMKNCVFLSLCLMMLCLGTAVNAEAANHYIRQGATGSANGNDWTNAYTNLPSSLVRGDTYYVAGGSYGSHTFNDSGTTTITIQHPTIGNHGTDTGWNDSYASQAVWSGWEFGSGTGNYTFDGVTGGGPGTWESGFGFKIQMAVSGGQDHAVGAQSGTISNLILRHIDVQGRGRTYGGGDTDLFYIIARYTNFTLSYIFFHDSDRTAILSWPASGSHGMIIEYSKASRIGSNVQHREFWSMGNDSDVIVRYSLFEDIYGTGVIASVNGSGTAANWQVYGNIFYHTDTGNTVGGIINTGVITTGPAGTWPVSDNWVLYNNIVANIGGGSFTARFDLKSGTNIIAQNNLWYRNTLTDPNIGSSGTVDYNWFYGNTSSGSNIDSTGAKGSHDIIGSSNPFVDAQPWNTGNWILKAAIGGNQLGAPYNVDMLGNSRGADGVWDRGAIEFVNGLVSLPSPTNLQIQ